MASNHVGKKRLEKERWGARDLCKGTFAKLARTSEVEITGFLWENAVSGDPGGSCQSKRIKR